MTCKPKFISISPLTLTYQCYIIVIALFVVVGLFTPTADVKAALPNLIIESHNLSSITGGTKGTAITLQGTLKNNGGGSTGATVYSNFTYKWGSAGTWTSIQEFDKGTVPAITTAAQDEISFTPGQTGVLYLQYCVDSRNEIDEGTGESNNCVQVGPLRVNGLAPNTPPVSDAGSDKETWLPDETSVIIDDATAYDAEGDALRIFWTLSAKPLGSPVTINFNTDTLTPTFTKLIRPGVYTFRMNVSDGQYTSMNTTMIVTVDGEPGFLCAAIPVANASFYPGDNTDLLADTSSVYSAVNTAAKCEYTCNFGYVWNSGSCVIPNLTINSHNLSSITGGTEGTAITLQGTLRNSGTAATPVDVYSNFTYKWGSTGTWTPIQEFNKGTVAAGITATQDETWFTPDQAGFLYLQYCVDSRNQIEEGAGESGNCMEVGPLAVTGLAPNTLPTVNAGSDKEITQPIDTVTINDATADDVDGDTLTYFWNNIKKPLGSPVPTVSNSETQTPTFSNLVSLGDYIFRMHVSDGTATVTATMTVTVLAPNTLPTVNAGSDKEITQPIDTVTINDATADDVDGDTLTYFWNNIKKPLGSPVPTVSNSETQTPTFSNLVSLGDYIFRMHVSDGTATVTATMTVTVLEESLPNLTIDSHNLSSITGGTEGTAITLQGTLRNSGTAATPVDVYSNFTYKWGVAGTWTPIQEFNKGTVAANTTATQDETSFTPNQAGSLYLQYCVDSRNEIDEGTDETPNCTESAEVVVDAFEPPTLFFDHSCVPGILAEANSCNTARVTWNLQAGSGNYLVRNITTGNIISTASTSPAGGQLITLRYGNNIVEGSATGIAPDLSVPRFQDCALGLFYYPMQNRCKNKPQLTFPTLNSSSTWIRSGKLQEISYQVVANYPVRCTYTPDTGGILSKLSADFANPVGPAGGTDTFTVGPLKSAQIVRITCQANPPVPGSVVSHEIRVNVVPEMIER